MKKVMNSTLAVAASLLLMFSMSAMGQTSGSSSTSSQSSDMSKTSKSDKSDKTAKSGGGDQQFAMKAAEGGKAEVELGQLALQKASSDDVKKFAQRMVDDHTKASQELQSAVSSKSMTLPDKPGAKEQAEKDRLSKLSGPAFDKAYMDHMVKDHTKDVAEFRKEANSGQDSAIKDFASKTLPTLEDHLKQAKTVDQMVKSNKSAKSDTGSNTSDTQNASNKKSKSY